MDEPNIFGGDGHNGSDMVVLGNSTMVYDTIFYDLLGLLACVNYARKDSRSF